MKLPVFYHFRNSGGNSFLRAVGAFRAADDDVLVVNDEAEFESQRHRLMPEAVGRLSFAFGHRIYLADPWLPDRYEVTMLRWPQAVFCADGVTYHEQLPEWSMRDVWTIADPMDRLRAYLDRIETGGPVELTSLVQWLGLRHDLGYGPNPARAERLAATERCNALLAGAYHLVAITELMDESLVLFQLDHPERRVTPWIRSRVNKQRLDPLALPADVVERFEREYAADIVLYQRARRRLLDRFALFWRQRPQLHDYYLGFKTAMILTDPLLMARFAAGDPLYFPPELPLEELRASVVSKLDRAHEIRANVMRAYG